MARVTENEVKAILDTTLEPSDLEPFIAAGNRVVEDNLAGLSYVAPGGTLTLIPDETLNEIERWLAAHFAAHWDKRTAEEEGGPGRFKYEGVTGKQLEFTRYGQAAMALDPSGTLAALGSEGVTKPDFLWSMSGT